MCAFYEDHPRISMHPLDVLKEIFGNYVLICKKNIYQMSDTVVPTPGIERLYLKRALRSHFLEKYQKAVTHFISITKFNILCAATAWDYHKVI